MSQMNELVALLPVSGLLEANNTAVPAMVADAGDQAG